MKAHAYYIGAFAVGVGSFYLAFRLFREGFRTMRTEVQQ